MSDPTTVKVAVIGSGNIGTDLMIKVIRHSRVLEMGAMVGIDPDSDGLARARRLGVPTTSDGVEGLLALPGFADIEVIFDATSAKAHAANAALLQPLGKRLVDAVTPHKWLCGRRPIDLPRERRRHGNDAPPRRAKPLLRCGSRSAPSGGLELGRHTRSRG